MDITAVDRAAVLGTSRLHIASARAKVIAFTLILATVVVTNDVLMLLSALLLLLSLATGMGMPLRRMVPLALYPAVFAAVFAFASAPSALSAVLIVGKAVTAALGSIVLMFSTPYPRVFAIMQRFVPGIVGDALLMTYRSLFLLAEKLTNLLTAIKLRAGLSGRQPVRAFRATTRALGGLLLYSLDLSQREYDVLRLRGYERRLRVRTVPSADVAMDRALLVGAAGLVSITITVRWAADAVGAYSWMLATLCLLTLVVTAIARRRKS
ncbi:MAG: energy-coupling factor transporter transmembrane component T [Coriobacteriia bacterium]|nr:energy-coupling factor transporter transmembrane component T [Coriobacteriia bacterium]